MSRTFKPVLYAKAKCPFCMKVDIFLLEAGLRDQFEIREFDAGDANEEHIRAELAPHIANVTFPSVQYAPGQFMKESDDIIAHFASEAGLDPAKLPVFSAFMVGMMARQLELYREVAALKLELAERA